MAVERAYVKDPASKVKMQIIKWSGLLNTDYGTPYVLGGWRPYKTVQVFGTFGASGKVVIQGTNETGTPTNWFTLTNQAGAVLEITAAGGKVVADNTYAIRPIVTVGDGTTLLTVILLLVGN